MKNSVELVPGEPPMMREDAEAIAWMVGSMVDVLRRDGWSRAKTLRALEVLGGYAYDRGGYSVVQAQAAK